MTTTEISGETALGRTGRQIRETLQGWTKAAFFGERPPLGREKETVSREERHRQEIIASLEKIK